MKKYYIKFITSILLLITCICPAMSMHVKATSESVYLYDEAGKLTQEEYQFCYESLENASDYTGMNIIVILGYQEYSETTIESLADSTYDTLFAKKSDGLCYYIDLRGHSPAYDYISTSGLAQFYYTNANSNNRIKAMTTMLDKYLVPAGSEDIVGAVNGFAEQLKYYYDMGIPERYYVYDNSYHEYYHVENNVIITTKNKPYLAWDKAFLSGMIGLILGIMIAVITYLVVKSHYKFQHALTPTNYVNKKTVIYRQQYDRFVRTRTNKTHISSSSGGHGGGGHHGGGHSSGGHGGGGHHR
ncbi:MAG: TPM domain-containing protein [Oscillospiraceae bacterium]|nr:TPM domain-containing protein [Oscillospiraceae bacterium]